MQSDEQPVYNTTFPISLGPASGNLAQVGATAYENKCFKNEGFKHRSAQNEGTRPTQPLAKSRPEASRDPKGA